MNGPASETCILAWARLMRSSQSIFAAIEGELKLAGFPPLGWYDVLLELRRAEGPLRPFALQQRLLIAQHNMSRLLDRLEVESYVRRSASAQDGRGQDISITDQGRALLRQMWPTYRAAIGRHLGAHITDDEAAMLAVLLGKLVPPTTGALSIKQR